MIESYLELIGTYGPGHPGARDPARGPGRRAAGARARRDASPRAGRADRAGRQGLEAAEVEVLGALARPARAGAAHRVRSLRPRRARGARGRRPRPRRPRRTQRVAARRPRALGSLPLRRRRARDLLDRRLAARRGLADVHGRAAGRSSAVRTVAVTFEPIPADRSTREVEAAVTRDRADRELRRRFGQSETARQRQAQEATARREAELAAGHGEVRLSGLCDRLGPRPRRPAPRVRRGPRARRARPPRAAPAVRPAGGGFTFTLPLCRGLR